MCETKFVMRGEVSSMKWFFKRIRVGIILVLKVKVVAARSAPWVFGSLITIGIVPGFSCHPRTVVLYLRKIGRAHV